MKLAKGLDVLEILNTLGKRDKIYLTLISDNKHVVLVDAGPPGSLQAIKDQMTNSNVSFDNLTTVILTHQDFDQMGGIWGITTESDTNKLEVMSHELEKEYVEGSKTPIKLTDEFLKKIKAMVNLHSVKKQKEINAVLENYYVQVDKTLTDNEELPICGGIKVIHIPGHTPGHICLYLKKYKTLIAGDALNVINGELFGPDAHTTPDLMTAIKSLKKLTELNIKTVICYRGGVYSTKVNKRLPILIEQELNELEQLNKVNGKLNNS